MGTIDDEIRRIIHATFSNSISSELPYDELVRIWTLDMQWMNPGMAPQIIDKLCETGWLTNSNGRLSPNQNVIPLDPPFGWSPIVRSLLTPPELVVNPVEQPRILIPEGVVKSQIEVVTNQKYPPDWAEASIKPMIAWISQESGLPMKEVVRRAQRKRRALGPVTLWMALSLVAREQGLNMSKIAELIGNPN
ncbi:MAG TPA: DUF2240 family protein [Candidatus Thalassarchaeaceae archaeon]|nr:MAG TPA: DUF2240 family protein [Candidatus Poseidoniales archaeon]HII29368.1 DUF2240 family protein [Candidatus Thalassarchaeaceae archaeon]|tara:strand:+ start:1212 stop:1787 length:576 start_codon:yes stop_codon:yes gene_type:complete